MPQIYDQSARKRRKGGQPEHDQPSSQPVQAAPPETQQYSNLGTVERESQGTLPTGLVWEVSNTESNTDRLRRAARLLARDVDIHPRYIFGDKLLKNYEDAIEDGLLKASALRRATDDFTPAAVEAMLRDVSAGESPLLRLGARGREETRGVVSAVSVQKTAQMASTLAKEFPDQDGSKVFALAAHLSRLGITPATYAENLVAIKQWARQTNQNVDWMNMSILALEATQAKQRFQTNLDVVAFLAGPKAQSYIKKARSAEATRAEARANAAYPVVEEGPGIADPLGDEMEVLVHARLIATEPKVEDLRMTLDELEDKIIADETAFQNSWLGRQFGRVGGFMEETWKVSQKGLVEIGSVISALGVYPAAAIPGGKSYEDAWNFIQKNRHYAYNRINGGDSVGDIVQEGFGLPTYAAPMFDLLAGWYADPFSIVGKGVAVSRGLRVAPELLEKTFQGRRLLRGLNANSKSLDVKIFGTPAERMAKQLRQFSESSVVSRLHKALYKGNTRYFREVELLRVNYEARSALDMQFMKALRDKVLQAHPTASAESLADFRQGILAHGGMPPLPGSLADEVVQIRNEGAATVHARLKATQVTDADNVAKEMAENFLFPYRLEVPQYRLGGVGRYGPRTLARRASTSIKVTETSLGRRAARLPSMNPGRILNFEDDPGVYIRLHARRARVFTEKEVRRYESMADEVLNVGPGKEQGLSDLVDEINREMLTRQMKPYKISDSEQQRLMDSILDPVRELDEETQAFAALKGSVEDVDVEIPILTPLAETQRKNTMWVIDPVVAENLIQRYVSTPRRLRASFGRAAEKLGLGDQKEDQPQPSGRGTTPR